MINIKGINTHVTVTGEGRTLLCLHGWAASHEAFTELRDASKNDPVKIIAPDLPGSGKTLEPPDAWSIDDYVDFVEELVKELNLNDVLLLGHSFGGRIAIKLAARKLPWISHLFLCASAGLRQKRYFKRKLSHAISKCGKAVFSLPGLNLLQKPMKKVLYKVLGVQDYEQASSKMRETMIKVINEDLEPYLEKIDVPTDLFWGEEDLMTPISDAEVMNKKIVQSTLHKFPNVRHRVHRDRAEEIATVIKSKLP